VLAALAWRVGYVLVTKRNADVLGDSLNYHFGANLLAEGKGYVDVLRYILYGQRFPGGTHPPLYVTYLAAWSLVGLKSALWHRLASCVLGAATVGLMGLLGRRLAGDRAGLLAAALAAAYPQLWLNDAALLSETAAAFAVVLAFLAIDRFRETPSPARALQVGGALALAVLGRAELVVLLPIVAIPLVLRAAGLSTRDRWLRIGAMAAAAIVLIGPWVGYNLVRFEKPVLLSNGLGPTLIGGSCDAAFYGSKIGYWAECPVNPPGGQTPIPVPSTATLRRWQADPVGTLAERRAFVARYFAGLPDESVFEATERHQSFSYIRAHKKQFVLVVGARIGRIWGVFRPGQTARFDGLIEGRGLAQARVALVAFYLYAVAAIGGLVVLRRRRQPIWLYLVVAALVTFTAAISFGVQRYRIPIDAVLPALAAVAIDALLRRRSNRRAPAPGARYS
jgi:4-amino-4-deoxy-L-arabinose transferase-like glycosyltransferase